MAERVLNFVNAGDQDVSEVTISTGRHEAGPVETTRRITYTISYPTPAPNSVQAFEETFAAAAKEIVKDAEARDVEPGEA
ncbi:MAG: hypothetical protein NXI21_16710 [Alphaproteobacteria bacterium]|nr:hypothetical protein [Alphaproteobacteria bacterium]